MKKPVKISLIVFVSFLLVLFSVAGALIWVVFTPERLTPIVQKKLNSYLTCTSEIGRVELTFFSTFPQFGLKVEQVVLIQKMTDSPVDTLLSAESVIASIDIGALWNNNQVIVRDLTFQNSSVTAFIDKEGLSNFDIMTSGETTDTSTFVLPFDKLELEQVVFKNAQLSFTDRSLNLYAQLDDLNATIKVLMKGDLLNGQFSAISEAVTFTMDSINYLKAAKVDVSAPYDLNIKTQLFNIDSGKLKLNDLGFTVDAHLNNSQKDVLFTDVTIQSDFLPVKPTLAIIPLEYSSLLEGISLDGEVKMWAGIKGTIAENSLPHFTLNLDLVKAMFAYEGLPYQLHDLSGNVDVDLDLNNEQLWLVKLNAFDAKTGNSQFEGTGIIDQLMGDMQYDLNLNTNFDLTDVTPMIPKDMPINLKGYAKGSAKTKFKLSEIMEGKYEQILFDGKFRLTDFIAIYDTITLQAKEALVDVKLPNKKSEQTGFADLEISSQQLDLSGGETMSAIMKDLILNVSSSNVLDEKKPLIVSGDFSSSVMNGKMDQLTGKLIDGKVEFIMEFNLADSNSLNVFDCDFDIQKLMASMDTISVDIDQPKGNFSYQDEKPDSDIPVISLIYQSDKIGATIGKQKIDTRKVIVNTALTQDVKQQNILLQWIPRGFITLEGGKINLPMLSSEIQIPSLKLDFSPDEFFIKESRIVIDRSDFSLDGKLTNMSQYLKNEGLLKGVFNFNSSVADVDHLMNLTNGIGYDEKAEVASASEPGSTFMVPRGIDITLNTVVDKALFATDTARDVRGSLTIKDGTMVLESMLFTASAAKMQLNALYKSPRKNHLYAGIDFHLLDIEIAELLDMIPDVDTIMPMLSSFGGKGEFHIAIETYLDSAYNIKKSTLRGVSSVRGENLILMDGETFSEIAKTLMFNKKTENKVDSLSAEFTIFRNEVDIYPFLIVMDKYKAVVSGKHNLDMNFDYHISVTDSPLPVKFGVDIGGNLDDLKIRPAKCRYANLYRPAQRKEIDIKQLEIRKMIRDALTDKVKQ
jgi:hypothetical protein